MSGSSPTTPVASSSFLAVWPRRLQHDLEVIASRRAASTAAWRNSTPS